MLDAERDAPPQAARGRHDDDPARRCRPGPRTSEEDGGGGPGREALAAGGELAAMTLNKMMIIGNLGADPELRYTPGGKAVAKLRVAVNDRYQGPDGEWQEETQWFRVELWEQAAERAAERLRKGHKVFAEGAAARARVGGQGRPEADIARDPLRPRGQSLERREPGEGAASAAASASGAAERARAPVGAPARRRSRPPPARSRASTSTTSRSDARGTDQPMPVHDPAASRRITTATDAGARSATSASTRPSRSTTRRSTASADTCPSARRSSRAARRAPARATSAC